MNDVKLTLLVLKTIKQGILLKFYETLGIKFVLERHNEGPIHYAGKLGDVVFEIYPMSVGDKPDSTTRLGFAVVNLKSIIELLPVETVVRKPQETKWGMRAVVRDPDGRSVELYDNKATS